MSDLNKHYQLIVVGAGPAGSNAALTAARAGLDVLLIERDAEIGQPLACAEAVTLEGLSGFIPPNPSFISTELRGIEFNVGDAYCRKRTFGETLGLILDRPVFDRHVADMAVKEGVRLLTQAYGRGLEMNPKGPARLDIVTTRGNRTVAADYVIAADGVESLIGRQAGLETELKLDQCESALQYRVSNIDIDQHCFSFYFGLNIAPGGYLWLFPKSANSANVGIGLNPTRFHGLDLRHFLDNFLEKRFPGAKIEFRSCGQVPKFIGFELLGRENLLLAGDAARTLDSVAGAGIAKALHTGQLAAQAVISAIEKKLDNNELQKIYRQTVNEQIGRDLRFCRAAYPVFRKFNDRDWESLIDFLLKLAESRKTGASIDPVSMVKLALAGTPSLLRLARHLL
ncbi:MAG: NAD(P)/FAD-dependent oxidoreductase [FCB group bacterium]|nr:NAD(P)/FAD-dependent oxidoreductase [FCB group bacterium]